MFRSRDAVPTSLIPICAILFALATGRGAAQQGGPGAAATAQGDAVKQQNLQQAQAQAQADATAKAAQDASMAAQRVSPPSHVDAPPASSQPARPTYNFAETAIIAEMRGLRATPDAERGAKTTHIATEIAALPGGINKLQLADNLSHLSTEGDFGRECLQTVASTLATALAQHPLPPEVDASGKPGRPIMPYFDLAKLVRYEHVSATLNDPEYARAQALLVADEADVSRADFTLTDLSGKSWTLSSLRGKVVLVNFWATWCPPCRKEMPDLAALSHRFADQGLVVLSLSNEDRAKVSNYVAAQKLDYPILLDVGGAAGRAFHVEGLPRSFLFGRDGKLTTESIDMRTQGQFLRMLAQAGLQTGGEGVAQDGLK